MLRKVASSFLFRRLIKALVTVFVMATLTFFLIRLMPGGPVEAYIANLVSQYNVSHQSAEQKAASLFSLDLDSPIYQNSPYEDSFTVIMLMDGTLKPAGQ